jgi:hypothetical protein
VRGGSVSVSTVELIALDAMLALATETKSQALALLRGRRPSADTWGSSMQTCVGPMKRASLTPVQLADLRSVRDPGRWASPEGWTFCIYECDSPLDRVAPSDRCAPRFRTAECSLPNEAQR